MRDLLAAAAMARRDPQVACARALRPGPGGHIYRAGWTDQLAVASWTRAIIDRSARSSVDQSD